ncbi:MAG: hypothetical protein KDD44_02965, partial [Bdellovibrionales bacterium]|nr:hypothetical protein [Bdellovibrionales bacterium]
MTSPRFSTLLRLFAFAIVAAGVFAPDAARADSDSPNGLGPRDTVIYAVKKIKEAGSIIALIDFTNWTTALEAVPAHVRASHNLTTPE